MIHKNPNIDMLEVAVEQLGVLIDEVVFLGGCATGLLLTDPAAPPLRITRDVDVIVEVASLAGYHRFTEKLRERGFSEDLGPKAPICRWQRDDLILDVMPTDPEILGFGNRWFERAFPAALEWLLPSGAKIRVLPSPYFLATKVEAFSSRGDQDFLLSRDVEDLIAVLDGRSEIVSEVENAELELQTFLARRLSGWLQNPDFIDALPGLLPPDAASQARSSAIIDRIKQISAYYRKNRK